MQLTSVSISSSAKLLIITALVAAIGVWLWSGYPSRAQGPTMNAGANSASLRPWRSNNKETRYTGPAACAKCHKEESANQLRTSMGTALETIATAKELSKYPRLTFKSGLFSYELVRKGDQSIYSVSDGVNTLSEPL